MKSTVNEEGLQQPGESVPFSSDLRTMLVGFPLSPGSCWPQSVPAKEGGNLWVISMLTSVSGLGFCSFTGISPKSGQSSGRADLYLPRSHALGEVRTRKPDADDGHAGNAESSSKERSSVH